MKDQTQQLNQEARIGRILDVLACASADIETDDGLGIEVVAEDTMGRLEAALAVFLDELAETREENARAIADLQSSREDLEQKLITIERQQLAIKELSTPVIDLWDGILTLPIVGGVDSRRAADMTERLLQRIVESESRCVIIDLTGVEILDTKTADHLVKMTQAVRLIGALPVITGIGPEIATTLVDLGVDLIQLRTVRTLKEGLKLCFRYLAAADAQNHGPGRAAAAPKEK